MKNMEKKDLFLAGGSAFGGGLYGHFLDKDFSGLLVSTFLAVFFSWLILKLTKRIANRMIEATGGRPYGGRRGSNTWEPDPTSREGNRSGGDHEIVDGDEESPIFEATGGRPYGGRSGSNTWEPDPTTRG